MRQYRSVPRLATVLALAMVAMLTMRCESQERPNSKESEETGGEFELLQMERYPRAIKILINRPQGTIQVNPPNEVICREKEACLENQFEWRIPGGLRENERLVIRGARQVCFTWEELVITRPSNAARSGPYLEDCEADDKYGYFWPYVVELFDGDERIAETDPSGIFRRR